MPIEGSIEAAAEVESNEGLDSELVEESTHAVKRSVLSATGVSRYFIFYTCKCSSVNWMVWRLLAAGFTQ